MAFPYKTEPLEHQRECLRLSAHREYFAVLSEQGTGKSKIIIDTAAYNYLRGMINGLFIIAPNGVHLNWVSDEIPAHMSDDVGWKALVWRSSKAGNNDFLREYKRLLSFKGLPILTMNIDAIISRRGKAAARNFLNTRKCLFVIDESQDIARAGSSRTITIRAFGKYAPMRRISTGTAARDGNPMDLYPQMQFLSPEILQCGSALAYKHMYAEWLQLQRPGIGPNGKPKRPIEIIAKDGLGHPKYKNLDKLNAKIAPHSWRVLKDDVLDLPPKTYSKRYFQLSSEQARIYRELLENWETTVGDKELVSVDLKIVLWLRLQQVICGYVPVDPDNLSLEDPNIEPERTIPGPNPRLELLVETLRENPNKSIIWCRYRYDAKLIIERLRAEGYDPLRYTGASSWDEKQEAKASFQRGHGNPLVANQQSAGRGLTLHSAHTAIYYSNYFGLDPRIQSEDRAHRIGLNHNLLILDLIAPGTIDERIVRALRDKKSVAEIIHGDRPRVWI